MADDQVKPKSAPLPSHGGTFARRSVFRNLALSMIGFGLLIGIIFPPFARIVLNTERALTPQFFALCMLAGFIVGLFNYTLFRTTVSRELTRLSTGMARILSNLTNSTANEKINQKEYRLTITSADAIGEIQQSFNDMSAQLRKNLESLNRRTRAVQTSADISRRLSTILDQGQLVREVVEQLQAAFGYYHAHIYLFDINGDYLVMAGGTGQAGQTLLARGHKLPHGKGLVGRAAETNLTVLVPDVSQDPAWLPNPLLPETRAEAAVPIAIGEEVLGVLDVQHNVAGGLAQDDADLLQSIANQVAIALRNAQAYEHTRQQARLAELESAIGQKIQRANSVEDVLQIAVRELGLALHAKEARVELSPRIGASTPGRWDGNRSE